MNDQHKPMMSDEMARKLRAWQDSAYGSPEHRQAVRMTYLGLQLEVPAEVHAPTPMSDLLGQAVLDEVKQTDRVLDMGTGSGANAILAASKSHDVVAVDVNAYAVECAKQNAERNGVADRINVLESDVFSQIDGAFDLIVFDPPFRWFKPRDIRDAATADENYRALTTFFEQAREYLKPRGRILLFFGTSGDANYLHKLIDEAQFAVKKLASRDLSKDGLEIEYFTYRLTKR